MRLTHGKHAHLFIAYFAAMHHLAFTNSFLVCLAALFFSSLKGCCKPGSPTHSLTLRAKAHISNWKHTKSRIASKRSGFFLYAVLTTMLPGLICETATASQITVATASNFLHTLKELRQPFNRQTGHKLVIVTGASGALATQIMNGAPYDVFLSADQTRVMQLVNKGFGDKLSHLTYAHGKLTLWSSDKSLIPNADGVSILTSGNFHHIAMANPALAPYGQAALETLKSLKLHAGLDNKIIYGENIAQTFTMLATGAAPIGFAARSQLVNAPWKSTGSFWHVPEHLHQPIKQDAVIVTRSKNKIAARQFLKFLKSPTATKIIESYGYGAVK